MRDKRIIPVFKEIGAVLKLAIRVSQAKMGVVMLSQEDGPVASIVAGKQLADPEDMERDIQRMIDRLVEIRDHLASGNWDPNKSDQYFVHDDMTGEFTEEDSY